MKLGRRKFFGLAAGAAVGGKKIATDVLGDMASHAVPMPGYGVGTAATSAGLIEAVDYTTELQGRVAKMAAIRAIGVPPVFREMLRSWMGNAPANLDDINCLVSVSVSAKKRMIRERMEEQALAEWMERPGRDLKRHLAEKEFGISI